MTNCFSLIESKQSFTSMTTGMVFGSRLVSAASPGFAFRFAVR